MICCLGLAGAIIIMHSIMIIGTILWIFPGEFPGNAPTTTTTIIIIIWIKLIT